MQLLDSDMVLRLLLVHMTYMAMVKIYGMIVMDAINIVILGI